MISQPLTYQKHLSKAFIALGANQPDDTRLIYLRVKACLENIAHAEVVIRQTSRFYQTPCFPAGAGPDFINAIAELETSLSPQKLLQHLHSVEANHGRIREIRWGPRTLDIDLLSVDQHVLPNPETFQKWLNLPLEEQKTSAPDTLILPHPRIQDRSFVLVPWADIAPDWIHPVTGLSVKQMLAQLDPADVNQIVPLNTAELD